MKQSYKRRLNHGEAGWGLFSFSWNQSFLQEKEFSSPIMAQNLQPSATELQRKRKLTFQQDNDPKHSSGSSRELVLPSQNPDLDDEESLY